MIPTDVMEAVERLRRNANGEWVVDIYDGNPDDARTAWTCDLVKLRGHCLPWLDQTPIDADWLREIGGKDDSYGLWMILIAEKIWLDVSTDGVAIVRDESDSVGDLVRLPNPITTRGQLLMLLTALGVTCKESNNG